MTVEEDFSALFTLAGDLFSGKKTLVELGDEALGNKRVEVIVTTADEVRSDGKPGVLLRVVPRDGGASAADTQPAPAVEELKP